MQEYTSQAVVCEPLIPALGGQRQAGFYQFEATLFYRGSSRTTGATQRNPVSIKENKTKNILLSSGLPVSVYSSSGSFYLKTHSESLKQKATTPFQNS